MNWLEQLREQECLRNHYWENEDYFLPLRLKWRAQMVRHLFHLFPQDSILELGAGSGQWTREISSANGDQNPVCAVTFDEQLYANIDPTKKTDNVESVCLDAFPGKLAGRRFDFIVGYHLLTDNNCGALLSELKNLLNPGGQILFFESNPWNPFYRIRKIFNIII